MVKMPVNWTVAFFCAAVIDFASRPLDGCDITISLIGLSPFRRYSVTHTVTGKSNGGQFLGCCERNLVYKHK